MKKPNTEQKKVKDAMLKVCKKVIKNVVIGYCDTITIKIDTTPIYKQIAEDEIKWNQGNLDFIKQLTKDNN
jgi:hypothetical protein